MIFQNCALSFLFPTVAAPIGVIILDSLFKAKLTTLCNCCKISNCESDWELILVNTTNV